MTLRNFDTIIIGAGAAGLMCGAVAGQHGRKVLILDHAKAVGEKIRISGGGRCNFTNLHCGPENFISTRIFASQLWLGTHRRISLTCWLSIKLLGTKRP